MKKTSRVLALLMTAVMLMSLTACSEEQMDFLKNGWDGGKEPTTVEEETSAEDVSEEATAEGEEVSDKSTDGTTKKASSNSSKKTSGNKNTSSSKGSSSGSGSSSSNSKTTTAKAGTTQKTYTAAEALELYKSAANKVKTLDGVTTTRTKEVITALDGEIPSMYESFGFEEGTNTEQKVLSTKDDIIDGFCVEGESYVCSLTASDIKSASVTTSGNNKIVTIYVKDDTEGTYDRSSKCVSTISIPVIGGDWTCKGVVVKGTINANGQLTALYYNMPTYAKSGSNSFTFSLEQYWTITY